MSVKVLPMSMLIVLPMSVLRAVRGENGTKRSLREPLDQSYVGSAVGAV